MKLKNSKGFTLIELLIVVAIIAILAAIAIPQFGAYRSRAVRSSMVADSKNIATTLETMFQDCNTYAQAAAATATGPGAIDLNATAATCTPDPTPANVSKNNVVTITAADAAGWTMTVANAGGNDSTFTGPITRTSAGTCQWTAPAGAAGSC